MKNVGKWGASSRWLIGLWLAGMIGESFLHGFRTNFDNSFILIHEFHGIIKTTSKITLSFCNSSMKSLHGRNIFESRQDTENDFMMKSTISYHNWSYGSTFCILRAIKRCLGIRKNILGQKSISRHSRAIFGFKFLDQRIFNTHE